MTFRLALAALLAFTVSAHAFDLQGHRGARGLAPENTLPGFEAALKIGVTTLELDLAVTKDDMLVVSHDPRLNPDITRGPDGSWLRAGPDIRSLTFAELQKFDVGRIRSDTAYAARFRDQQGMDNVRIPALTEVFELATRLGADRVRFNIETKASPDRETVPPELFAALVAKTVRESGLTSRVSVQSFDWRTLKALQQIAPEIERVCLTIEALMEDNIRRGKSSPWTAGLRVDDFAGSVPRLVQAAGCAVWSPYYRNLTAALVKEAHGLGLKVLPWTVNDMADLKLVIETGVDGIITDYPDRGRAALPKGVTPPPAVH